MGHFRLLRWLLWRLVRKSPPFPFFALPVELQLCIASHLTHYDLGRFRSTCRSMHTLLSAPFFQRFVSVALCPHRFRLVYPNLPPGTTIHSYGVDTRPTPTLLRAVAGSYSCFGDALLSKVLEHTNPTHRLAPRSWSPDLPVLMAAAFRGNYRAVKQLLAHGADPSAVNFEGCAPVHACVGYYNRGSTECLMELVRAGANVEAIEPYTGCTLLMLAVCFGMMELSVLLVRDGGCRVGVRHAASGLSVLQMVTAIGNWNGPWCDSMAEAARDRDRRGGLREEELELRRPVWYELRTPEMQKLDVRAQKLLKEVYLWRNNLYVHMNRGSI